MLRPQQYEKTFYELLKTLDRLNIKLTWWMDDFDNGIGSSSLSKYSYKYGYGRDELWKKMKNS